MVVDIGPRQSGKTTRLIESVVDYLRDNPNNTALVVSKHTSRKLIAEKIEDKCFECGRRVITSYKMLPPYGQTMKQFVDEFGHMKCENLVVDTNAYYNSSYYPDSMNRDRVHNKAIDIMDVYDSYHKLQPTNRLMRHKL